MIVRLVGLPPARKGQLSMMPSMSDPRWNWRKQKNPARYGDKPVQARLFSGQTDPVPEARTKPKKPAAVRASPSCNKCGMKHEKNPHPSEIAEREAHGKGWCRACRHTADLFDKHNGGAHAHSIDAQYGH